MEVLQILTSIRNDHPDKFNINIMPFVMEIARSLNINPESLVQRPQMQLGLPGPGSPEGLGAPSGIPPNIGAALPPQVQQTPIGAVLGSP